MKYLDLTGLGEVWANIKSYISSKIPTKTSQLQNDSSYATTSQLPSKTSQLTNDSGFLTSTAISNKADKATTLSGYGITDAYTKTQVDKKVSDLVNSAPETLDTLNELASALGNDPNFATTVASQIGTKANDSDVVHKSGYEVISGVKNFNDVVLGEQSGVIRIGNNGEGAHFCTLNYDGQIYNNLKQFIPKTNNEYYLGTSTNKWKDVNTALLNGKTPAYTDDLALKANIADTVHKTNTDYTFRNYSLNSLNFDEKYDENYVVGISLDGYGTRPIGGWTNIINFTSYHFITQLCIPIQPNKDIDFMYIRTRWANDAEWGEWRKSANDNSVVHKSGDETINGVKTFTSEIVNTSVHAFRQIYGNYGVFWRQDGYNLYLMLTNSGDQYGGWNNFRPIMVNLATGICNINGTAGGVAWSNVSGRPTKLSQFTNDSGYLTSGNVVDRTSNQSINGNKTFNNLIQAQDSLIIQNTDSNRFIRFNHGWIEMSEPNYCYVDFKHSDSQDYLGRIGLNPTNILFLETINGAPIMANGKNIVRSVNGVNADNNGNVNIQGFSNGIGEIIQGYYVPNGIVQKNGSVYFGTLVRPAVGATLNDSRDINITITNEFYPEAGKIYDYSQIFSTLYLHSYDSEYAVGATFYNGSEPKVDKWFGGWIKVAGSNLVRNSGKYLCTSVSPYGYAVTLRYNLTVTCALGSSHPGGSSIEYGCKIVSKTVPQNQMTVTAKATFMRVG